MKPIIYDYNLDEIMQKVVNFGEKKYRAKQIFDALFPCGLSSIYDVKNIPRNLQEKFEKEFEYVPAETIETKVSSVDNSVKFVLKLLDDSVIECVILSAKDRKTLCLSSQAGCALGCVFCETGKMGFKRNLSSGEILYQAIVANNYLRKFGKKITNIVFMGMGEALSNFENFEKAYNVIVDKKTFGIGTRKITVSTAGVIPNIKKLIEKKISIDLAISLNASNDSERNEIMPINKKYPVTSLIEIAKEYAKDGSRVVMFEYIMISKKNDGDENAKQLAALLKNVPCKVNVIPLNDCTNDFVCSSDERIEEFTKILHEAGIRVTVRRSGGRDIDGACGQLAGKH
ncbi:MAG: 23S rRNA (adenine(2503)-C(2))-methyltransferase RlmN [Chitinispirillales bacterium]|jgi:23S rRNA (adenine2503-C2)-methyltransferase|nr:23S rRNA (adenine(2503)-C(2))-methyltransferase RlmN [Chitinispirillales bacterium]